MPPLFLEHRTLPSASSFVCCCLLGLVAISGCSEEPAATGGTAAAAAPTAATAAPPQGGTAGAPTAGGDLPVGGAAGVAAAPAAGTPVPQAGATAGTAAAPATGGSPATGGAPAAAGAAGDAEPPPSTTTDWAMMGYDLGSSYNNSAETKLSVESAANLTQAWTANMGGNMYGAALQVGDAIYASGPNAVYAFDAATGDERWSARVSSSSSMSYADGVLYLNDNGSDIVAMDATSGAILWTKPSNPSETADGSSSALVAGDVVLIGGSNGTIELTGGGTFRGFMSALDSATGNVRWTEYTVPEGSRGASIWSSPSADLTLGYAFGTTGNNYGSPGTDTSDAFIAFDLATGAIVWKAQRVANDTFGGFGGGPDADFGANPVVYETMLDGVLTKLVGAGNKGGDAHAVRADDGTLVWTRDLGGGAADGSRGIFTNSAWTGRDLMVACNEGSRATLYALDGATGNIAWMRSLPGLVWGRTAVANGVGVVGAGNSLEVFDVATGDVIKTFPSGGGTIASTITIANGRIAFGDGLTWSSGTRGSTLTVLAVP